MIREDVQRTACPLLFDNKIVRVGGDMFHTSAGSIQSCTCMFRVPKDESGMEYTGWVSLSGNAQGQIQTRRKWRLLTTRSWFGEHSR